jgi:dsRNA-specific ribonuclease
MQRLRDDFYQLKIPKFLRGYVSPEKLKIVLSHEKNHRIANIGDSVLDLVLKEHVYSLNLSNKEIDDARQKHGNNELLSGGSVRTQTWG